MERMRPNLKDLRELHKCANNLLLQYFPMIQQALVVVHDSTLQHMSESILSLLDLCGTTRDVLLLAKEQLQELHSAARRTLIAVDVDDHDLEAQVSAHNLRMKKLKKEVAKCLRSLKDMYKHKQYVFASDLSLIDSNLIVVVHVLREVRVATVSIADSLLEVISTPAPYPPRGSSSSSLATRITQRLFNKAESAQAAAGMTVLLDAGNVKPLQDLEVELDCIMRRLIHTRVLLLNILNN